MSELKDHFERLMNFAKQSNFHKPFSEVCFVESKSIQYYSNQLNKISRQEIFSFENYENRFNEALNQGHSWINMNLAGVLNDFLLVIIEVPNYKNNSEFTEVNLSLPDTQVIENDWNISPFYEIV